MVLTMFALVGGALLLWRRSNARIQVVLMLALAAVIGVNVAIWTIPDRAGQSLLDAEPDAGG